MDTGTIISSLGTALETLDRAEIDRLCDELVDELWSSKAALDWRDARKILKSLRRKRCFRQMQRIADACIQTGTDDPVVRRQYAQALLDQRDITAALTLLEPLAREPSSS